MEQKPNIRGMWDRIEEQANEVWPTDTRELMKNVGDEELIEETLEKIQERDRAIEMARVMTERLRSEAITWDNRIYNLKDTVKLMKDWLVVAIPITKQGNYIVGPWTIIAKLHLDVHIYDGPNVPLQYWSGQNPDRTKLYKAILAEGKEVRGARKQESYELTILPVTEFQGPLSIAEKGFKVR